MLTLLTTRAVKLLQRPDGIRVPFAVTTNLDIREQGQLQPTTAASAHLHLACRMTTIIGCLAAFDVSTIQSWAVCGAARSLLAPCADRVDHLCLVQPIAGQKQAAKYYDLLSLLISNLSFNRFDCCTFKEDSSKHLLLVKPQVPGLSSL